ncbi:MAG: MBL fold metallo-hydrolase [Patescibacteria group bacterium]|nr:MBL fold metallo-hydrolase [Patescibacteria group bacterium]
MKHTSKLTFHGGAGAVTGANFLLEDKESGAKILVDCGFFQGRKFGEDTNREPFPYDPASIDVLFVTHAHIDHIGRIPKLVRDGFRGVIYSTPETKEIGELMLTDSMGILGKEAAADRLPPIYDREDVEKTMNLWQSVPYHHTPINLKGGFQVTLKDAGHILGSAQVVFMRAGRTLVFTGDLGNSPAPLLRDTEPLGAVQYVVMESVYGDRNHESRADRKQMLEDVIEDTIKKGGALVVPAFSLERTQELLFEINDLVEHGRIPAVPVFVDSPLAIKVTRIYKNSNGNFNHNANDVIKSGDDIFNFPRLKFTMETEESKAIKEIPNPKVIIAGSGMSNGGRIIHHEKHYLPDSKSTILLIGYQSVGTMGRALEEGAKNVTIMGDSVPVEARIAKIRGYSAHKDSDALVDFVRTAHDGIERVFVVMGEPKAEMFLAQRLRDYLGINATVPQKDESIEINL